MEFSHFNIFKQNLARDNGFFRSGQDGSLNTANILAETHATDSYQNILFSILLYRRHTKFLSAYPEKITIVTHDFKRDRFLDLHLPAIGIGKPAQAVDAATALSMSQQNEQQASKTGTTINFIGINPPEDITPLSELVDGEEKRGISLWKRDLYGTGEVLSRKRRERGWNDEQERAVLEGEENEVVKRLVRWQGEGIFPDMDGLPWIEKQ